MHHELPAQLDLAWYRKQAKDLLRAHRDGEPDSRARVQEALGDRDRFQLSDAQHVLAVEHGFRSWADFKRWVETREQEPKVGRIGRSPIAMYERRAQSLVDAYAKGEDGALRRVQVHLPRGADDTLPLRDAKVVVAREYGFPAWRDLVRYQQKAIDEYQERPTEGDLARAWDLMAASDVDGLRKLLDERPELVGEHYSGAASTLLEALTQPEQRHVDLRVAELLIERGSAVDVPLNLAACFNYVDLVRLLLAAGARHYADDIWGITPLQTAIYHGAREAVDVLAPLGLVPRALYVSAAAGRELETWFDEDGELVAEALRVRPNLSDVGWPPQPPPRDDAQEALGEALALAAYSGRIEAMAYLLERGASPDGKANGLTALHLAVITNRLATVRWLVEHGADPAARDDIHDRPVLGWAAGEHPGSAVHDYLASVS
jgi:hypothetical protein